MRSNVVVVKMPRFFSGFMEDVDDPSELEGLFSRHPGVKFEVDEWRLHLGGGELEVLRAFNDLQRLSFDASIEWKSCEGGVADIGFY